MSYLRWIKQTADDISFFPVTHGNSTYIKEISLNLNKAESEHPTLKKSFNPDLSKSAQEVLFIVIKHKNKCNISHFSTIQDFVKLDLKKHKHYIRF